MGRSGAPAARWNRSPFRTSAPRSISTQARVISLSMNGGNGEWAVKFSLTNPISDFPFPGGAVKPSLEDTLALMKDLRRRCEWDAAQTHESLRPYLIEEAHEVDDALLAADDQRLREELGDL